MFDRNPIQKTAFGTSYHMLDNSELMEIGRLDQIRKAVDHAFCANCDPVIDSATRMNIRDSLDDVFKELAIRIKDIEAIADRRQELADEAMADRGEVKQGVAA